MKNVQLLSCLLLLSNANAFAPLPSVPNQRSLSHGQQQQPITRTMMAGFGAPSDGGKKKKGKEQKLKPKQQWDRYLSLKKETSARVAVQVEGGDDWLEVGRVKSKDNASTEAAVARQRVLIAEHSRRLFPLQIGAKDTKVQWAYLKEGIEDQWVLVKKSVLEGAAGGIEKEIGFEGRPDPSTGFYCMYKGGQLIEKSFEGNK